MRGPITWLLTELNAELSIDGTLNESEKLSQSKSKKNIKPQEYHIYFHNAKEE